MPVPAIIIPLPRFAVIEPKTNFSLWRSFPWLVKQAYTKRICDFWTVILSHRGIEFQPFPGRFLAKIFAPRLIHYWNERRKRLLTYNPSWKHNFFVACYTVKCYHNKCWSYWTFSLARIIPKIVDYLTLTRSAGTHRQSTPLQRNTGVPCLPLRCKQHAK